MLLWNNYALLSRNRICREYAHFLSPFLLRFDSDKWDLTQTWLRYLSQKMAGKASGLGLIRQGFQSYLQFCTTCDQSRSCPLLNFSFCLLPVRFCSSWNFVQQCFFGRLAPHKLLFQWDKFFFQVDFSFSVTGLRFLQRGVYCFPLAFNQSDLFLEILNLGRHLGNIN